MQTTYPDSATRETSDLVQVFEHQFPCLQNWELRDVGNFSGQMDGKCQFWKKAGTRKMLTASCLPFYLPGF